jgi:hypothetical protein
MVGAIALAACLLVAALGYTVCFLAARTHRRQREPRYFIHYPDTSGDVDVTTFRTKRGQ